MKRIIPVVALLFFVLFFCRKEEGIKKDNQKKPVEGREKQVFLIEKPKQGKPRTVQRVYFKKNTVIIKEVLVTAYCPGPKCCGKYADGKTATGRDAYKTRGVAVDPKVIPYGTIVNIPGAGKFIADDTGGRMKESWCKEGIIHLDLRFPSYKKALAWGEKILPVEFIFPPEEKKSNR